MSEVNSNIERGHFQKMGNVVPTLEFWRHLANEILENTIGMYPRYESRTKSTRTMPEVIPCDLVTDPFFSGRWLLGLKNKKRSINIKISAALTSLHVEINAGIIVNVPNENSYKKLLPRSKN